MARLELGHAPPAQVPLGFLLASPLWGVVAGLLLIDAGPALASRWSPATLALVHAFALGVLGNAMSGALLQFLPTAAAVPVRGGRRAAYALLALLNLGTVLLVSGFHQARPTWLVPAAVLLGAAFAVLGAIALPGVLRGRGQRLLHSGLGCALVAALVTAALGAGMAVALAGLGGPAPVPWADVHALWGLLGWVLVLLAAVARVTMPMFQGTGTPSAWGQALWLLLVAMVLLPGSLYRVQTGAVDLQTWGTAVCTIVFAATGLWLQWRAPHARNPALMRFWRTGFVALLAAALVLYGGRQPMLAGTLAIAIGLPLLLAGMQLEIVAFIGWLALQRRVGRGVHLPGVQRLLPAGDKNRVLAGQLFAAATLLLAVLRPEAWSARVAGAAVAAAYVLLAWTLLGPGRRARRFQASLPPAAGVAAGDDGR